MFENKLNFRFHSDLDRDKVVCRNRSPQPGELTEYWPIDEGAKRTVYAMVAFLPNLNDGGRVLIIAGSSSGAQEIAAEFVTNEKLLNAFVNRIWKDGHRLPYFEILIRTITLAGGGRSPKSLRIAFSNPKLLLKAFASGCVRVTPEIVKFC